MVFGSNGTAKQPTRRGDHQRDYMAPHRHNHHKMRNNNNNDNNNTGRKSAHHNLSILPEHDVLLSSASPSNFARHRQSAHTSTPPASAFFPLLSANSNAAPRPTPDAQAHFSYSTTLRRHPPDHSLTSPAGIASAVNAEAASLWQRLAGFIAGKNFSQHGGNENAETVVSASVSQIPTQLDRRDTLSARFAHSTIDVGHSSVQFYDTNIIIGHYRLL
jgi:hypothetical protein